MRQQERVVCSEFGRDIVDVNCYFYSLRSRQNFCKGPGSKLFSVLWMTYGL